MGYTKQKKIVAFFRLFFKVIYQYFPYFWRNIAKKKKTIIKLQKEKERNKGKNKAK
jgi:hypothetical protein